jgi:predicted Rossmann fold flavoprotein
MTEFDLIIVGGSASGLCAAIQAARTNRALSVAVLERMPRVGKKILATGNGRCNLSNTDALTHPYHNAAFAKAALAKYDVEKTLAFFKSLGLLTVTDREGRIYPMSNTAASLLDALRFEAERLNVKTLCNTTVKGVKKLPDGRFSLSCTQTMPVPEGAKSNGIIHTEFFADKLIIAAGGQASPAHGSDGSGYELLRQLGHSITPLFPALVQLITDSTTPKQMKGIRVNAAISVETDGIVASTTEGEVLFTEYGLSGIAAMEVSRAASAYFAGEKEGGCFAVLDLAPSLSKDNLTGFVQGIIAHNPTLSLEKLLCGILPTRVGQAVCKYSDLYDFNSEAGELSQKQIDTIVGSIKRFRLEIKGTRGFEQAQITAGGADVSEFNADSMQSRKISNLYSCGEILDVDGGCGGFNLQWAWSSGLLAGELKGVTC